MATLCPNKQICGSCGLSEIPYEDQLKQKLKEINDFAKSSNSNISIEKIIPSPVTSHYRNRMDYAISYRGEVGLKQKGKWWKVIDGHTCFIADTQIEQKFFEIRDWVKNAGFTFYDRRSHLGLLRYTSIRSTTTGETMVTIITNPPVDSDEKNRFLLEIKKFNENSKPTVLIWGINSSMADTSFCEKIIPITSNDYITENINNFEYKITPNSFFQTNPHTAKILQDYINNTVKNQKFTNLLDLYCGSGFFAIGASKYVKNITGVEVVEEAVNDANQNKLKNKISNINFLLSKSEEVNLNDYNPNIIITDPPRIGLDKNLIDKLKNSSVKTLIYISCNYKKFVEDAILLSGKFKVKDICAIDMFPHTPHVEIASIFTI